MYFYVVKCYSHCSDEKVQKAKSGRMPVLVCLVNGGDGKCKPSLWLQKLQLRAAGKTLGVWVPYSLCQDPQNWVFFACAQAFSS